MRVLTRMEIPNAQNNNLSDSEKAKIETLKKDKSQATIANFLNKESEEEESDF